MTNIRPAVIKLRIDSSCDRIRSWRMVHSEKSSDKNKKSVCQIHLKDIVCFGPVFICSETGGKDLKICPYLAASSSQSKTALGPLRFLVFVSLLGLAHQRNPPFGIPSSSQRSTLLASLLGYSLFRRCGASELGDLIGEGCYLFYVSHPWLVLGSPHASIHHRCFLRY